MIASNLKAFELPVTCMIDLSGHPHDLLEGQRELTFTDNS